MIPTEICRSPPGNPSDPEVVVPADQENGFTFYVAVRASTDPMSLRKPILDVLRSTWPDAQMINVTTVDKMAGDKVALECGARRRFAAVSDPVIRLS